MKLIGKRSAGKPHAAFDVAEAGNMICIGCVRQSSTLPDGEGLETDLMVPRQSSNRKLLPKQLKQNFPYKYFLGDNENEIEIQIWSVILANLLITPLRSKIKRRWAFHNMLYCQATANELY